MSAGRKAARMRRIATGVIAPTCALACLGAFAASASAAKGGNSAAAALCHGGYAGVLLAQDGSAFKNEGKCTSYAAKGGQLVGVNAVAGRVKEIVPGFSNFEANYSGFGLKPETVVFACDTYRPSGETECVEPEVAADGTFLEGEEFPCTFRRSKVSNLFVQATTAGGVFFTREFLPPAGC